MRAIAWVLVSAAGLAVLGGCSSGCPDETYEQEMVVTVSPEDCPEGAHVLRGTADGVPFSCELDCLAASIEPGDCEGGAVVQPMEAGDPTVVVKLAGKPEQVTVELAAVDAVEPLRRRELSGGPVSGCAGPESWNAIREPYCDDGLSVELAAVEAGTHEFEGTADGVEFRCTYVVTTPDAATTEVRDATCTGPVEIEAESYYDGERRWPGVKASFAAEPAVLVWSFVVTSESGRATETGTLAPTYAFDTSGCRVAEAEVP